MVTDKEIQDNIKWAEEFGNNIVRATSTSREITRNRARAIDILCENLKNEDGLKLLSRCVKNEKWLLMIIKDGIKKSKENLKEVISWFNKNIKDKTLRKKANQILEIVELFEKNQDKINRRIELEEYFLVHPEKDTFKKYIKAWDEETSFQIKVIKKVAGIKDIDPYINKLRKLIIESLKVGILAGATGAFLKEFYYIPSELDLKTSIFMIGAAGIILNALTKLSMFEEDRALINLNSIKKAKKAAGIGWFG